MNPRASIDTCGLDESSASASREQDKVNRRNCSLLGMCLECGEDLVVLDGRWICWSCKIEEETCA